MDTIRDINDRHGLEVQIMEFGQIPKQIFTLPHPRRMQKMFLPNESLLSANAPVEDSMPSPKTFKLERSTVFQSHKDGVTCVIFINGEMEIASVGHDGTLKLHSLNAGKLLRSVTLSNLPLSSCISYNTSTRQSVLIAASWDNTL